MKITGYHVWVYGERFWHKTLNGAIKRAKAALRWSNDVQIIEIRTGNRVW